MAFGEVAVSCSTKLKFQLSLLLWEYRGEINSDVKDSVCFVLVFALPCFSPPLPSVVQFFDSHLLHYDCRILTDWLFQSLHYSRLTDEIFNTSTDLANITTDLSVQPPICQYNHRFNQYSHRFDLCIEAHFVSN